MNMLVSAAALSNSASIALPAEADPIFAAIDAHCKAVENYNEHAIRQDQLEDQIPIDMRRSKPDNLVETDDPRWIEYQKRTEELSEREIEAECELTNVTPTTLAGVIALLDYAVTVERELGFREIYFDPDDPSQKYGRSWHYFVSRNLANTLRSLAA